jgi:hypothetical protein
MPPKKALYREVGTKEMSPSVPKFNPSACRWKKADLALLGVDYEFGVFDDGIERGIENPDMPTECSDAAQ